MYQLHYFPANANAAPHMVLEAIGIEYDLVFIDRAKDAQKSTEYLKINPNGRIPTLVDGTLIVSEAAAIVLHRRSACRRGTSPAGRNARARKTLPGADLHDEFAAGSW